MSLEVTPTRMSDGARHDRPLIVAGAGFFALVGAMGIGRFVYTPILPFMVADLGLTKTEAGLIASANFLGYLLGAFAAAYSPTPGGRSRWFILSLVVSAMSTAAMGATTTLIPFMVLRFIGGVASAYALIFGLAIVLDHLSAINRTGYSSVHFGGVGTGIALSAIMVALISAQGLSWEVMWFVASAIALVTVVLAAMFLPPERMTVHTIENSDTEPAPQQPSNQRALAALITGYGLYGFGYIITATFITVIVRESPDLKEVEFLVWFVLGVSAIPSVFAWIWVAKHKGMALAIAAALLVESVAVILTVLSFNPAIVVLAAILFGATFVGIAAQGLVYARQLATGDARRIVGLMTASFGVGQIVGPLFAGYAFDLTGDFTVASLSAAATLAIAALMIAFTRPSPA